MSDKGSVEGMSCLVVAADFRGVNTPAPLISSYQLGVTERGAGKGCTQSRAHMKDSSTPLGRGGAGASRVPIHLSSSRQLEVREGQQCRW